MILGFASDHRGYKLKEELIKYLDNNLKEFLDYIRYPDSMNLEENFPLKEVDYLIYGKLTEEIDILEEIYINLRKKAGNSIIKKGK